MTKKEIVWLLIRIAGAYLLWQGVGSSVGLVANLAFASSTPELLSKSAGAFLGPVVMTGLDLSLGLYLLINGRVVFNLLSDRPDSLDE